MTGCQKCPHLYIEHDMDRGCKKCPCIQTQSDIIELNKKGTVDAVPTMDRYAPKTAMAFSVLLIIAGTVMLVETLVLMTKVFLGRAIGLVLMLEIGLMVMGGNYFWKAYDRMRKGAISK